MTKKAVTMLVLAAVTVMAIAAPAMAETIIACEYDTENQIWAWDLGFEHSLTNWLDFGATLRCYLNPGQPYGLKAGLIPAGVPYLQRYEIWARLKWRAFSISISDWCGHYLTQSSVPASYDTWGLTLRVECRL